MSDELKTALVRYYPISVRQLIRIWLRGVSSEGCLFGSCECEWQYGEGMASTSKLHRDVRQDRGNSGSHRSFPQPQVITPTFLGDLNGTHDNNFLMC